MQIKLIRYKTILNICVVMDLFYFYDCYFRKKNPGPFDFSRQEVLQIGEQWWTLKSNWNLDTGYSKSFTNTPRNIRSTGFWNSVEFILAHHDSFYGCSSKHGFTVERVIVVFWLLILYYRNLLADKIVLKNITLTLYSKRHNARHNCIMHSENSYNREIYIFEQSASNYHALYARANHLQTDIIISCTIVTRSFPGLFSQSGRRPGLFAFVDKDLKKHSQFYTNSNSHIVNRQQHKELGAWKTRMLLFERKMA